MSGSSVPKPLDRDATVERIYAAKFRERPHGGAPLTKEAIATTNVGALQEPGTRPSCPLPYELVVNGDARDGGLTLVDGGARRRVWCIGAGRAVQRLLILRRGEMLRRAYAVRAGDVRARRDSDRRRLSRSRRRPEWLHARVRGTSESSDPTIVVSPARARVPDRWSRATKAATSRRRNSRRIVRRPVEASAAWSGGALSCRSRYADARMVRLHCSRDGLVYRYAGRIETGKWSITDPAMGEKA